MMTYNDYSDVEMLLSQTIRKLEITQAGAQRLAEALSELAEIEALDERRALVRAYQSEFQFKCGGLGRETAQ